MLKRWFVVAAFGLISVTGPGARAENPRARVQSARITFARSTCVMGHVLSGSYILVHDQNKMDSGEPCTTIYDQTRDGTRPVVSFRCTPKPRAAVDHVLMSVVPEQHSPGLWMPRLTEYQFAGDAEGHGVPY